MTLPPQTTIEPHASASLSPKCASPHLAVGRFGLPVLLTESELGLRGPGEERCDVD